MKYLLDTHVVLWSFSKEGLLSKKAVHAIMDPANRKYVSIASAWELAIKIGTGKLTFEGGVELFFQTVRESGFVLLPIRRKHIQTLETLPFLHRDPFDRILIASAMTDNMCLITADTNIRLYDVVSLW